MTDFKLTYQGIIKDNGLHIYHRKVFDSDIQVWNGKDVVITIQRKRRRRSLEQNNYYWACVVPMVKDGLKDVGYKVGIEETHDYLKSTFLKDELVNEETGEVLQTIGSTTKLTTVQFMEFIADVQRWAAEFLGLVIPDPNEQVKIEFTNKQSL